MTTSSLLYGGISVNRNEKRKRETREKIKTAGRKVLTEYGYNGASVAKIMEYADLGHGTFYQHFKDKEQLLTEMFYELELKLREYSMGKIPKEEKSIEKRILVGIRSVIFFYNEYKDMLSILKAAMVENETFKNIGSDIQKVIFEKAVRDYDWSKKNGLCRDIDQRVVTMCIVNIIQGAGDEIIANQYSNEGLEELAVNVAQVCFHAFFSATEIPF